MKFTIGDHHVILQGDPSLCKSYVSLKAMFKALEHGGEGVFIKFNNIDLQPTDFQGTFPVPIESLLTDYASVFERLEGLPPKRTWDHAIVLREEGTN